MRVIYVAGPYRSTTEWGLEQNIRHAEEAARQLWAAGWAVICPHKNTAHFGGAVDDGPQHDLWLQGDLEILRRCDAVFMLSTWDESSGARGEQEEAIKSGRRVYYETDGIPMP